MHNIKRKTYLAKCESAHSSSSITLRASLVSHQEARKPQQPSHGWIHFKSFLDKLMFYILQLGDLVYTISKS